MAATEDLRRHYRHATFFLQEIHKLDMKAAENQSRFHEAATMSNGRVPDMIQLRKQKESIQLNKQELEMRLNNHLISLCVMSCRKLCDLVSTMLPRELRDMIYEHLVTQDPRCPISDIQIVKDASFSGYPSHFAPSDVTGAGWRSVPHFWGADWVGEGFMQELIQIWYKTSTFDFRRNYHLIESFLNNENWKGLVAADLVRHVQCLFKVGNIEYGKEVEYEEASDAMSLCANLRKLNLFRDDAHVRIDITFPYKNWRLSSTVTDTKCENFKRVLKDIWPVLSDLNASGKVLKIVVERHIALNSADMEFSIEAWVQKLREVSLATGGLTENHTYIISMRQQAGWRRMSGNGNGNGGGSEDDTAEEEL